MTSRQGTRALAIVGCLLLVLTGCTQPVQQATGREGRATGAPPDTGGGSVAAAAVIPPKFIVFKLMADGSCQQNDAAAPVNVTMGAVVIWQSSSIAPGHTLKIRFLPGGSPFETFDNVDGSAITSGPTSGQKDDLYPYAELIVDKQKCNNLSQLGIIMR